MARLYANENFPHPVVEALIKLGHDVLTTAGAGNAGKSIPDDEVLAFSIAEQRALLTLNRLHFLRLVSHAADHPGLIVCTFDADFDRQARAIDEQIRLRHTLHRQVIRVNRPAR